MIVAIVDTATDFVVMLNVVVSAPAGTVTEAGTTALVEFEERLTARPPAGAGPVIVRVPVEGAPPMTVAGAIARL